ncbi:MAG: substrate-binding domain-containing protein [Paracoccus sp. (in: a-proteobacteria)]
MDGLILARIAPQDSRIALLKERGVPFVALGRQQNDPGDYSLLDVDSGAAFVEAVKRLAALGHRHIGLVSITDDLSFARHRDDATVSTAQSLGLKVTRIAAARADREGRLRGIPKLLSGPDRPTAILGLVDEIALDALNIAAEMGLSVPRDLSVIGFDDIAGAAHSTPPLSTFQPYNRRLGQKAAHVLADLIARPDSASVQLLATAEFVERASHGPAPG